jgi:chromatin remodeling complex protein RSC6
MEEYHELYQFDEQFKTIEKSLSTFRTQLTSLQHQLRTLDKSVKREITHLIKNADKNKNKRKGNRKPSGFAKPTKISSELCKFMNKEDGTEVARTEVTQFIINYVKENKLANSKVIHPDDNLKQLLDLNDDDELTYFNIQKYMNKHFIKSLNL